MEFFISYLKEVKYFFIRRWFIIRKPKLKYEPKFRIGDMLQVRHTTYEELRNQGFDKEKSELHDKYTERMNKYPVQVESIEPSSRLYSYDYILWDGNFNQDLTKSLLKFPEVCLERFVVSSEELEELESLKKDTFEENSEDLQKIAAEVIKEAQSKAENNNQIAESDGTTSN